MNDERHKFWSPSVESEEFVFGSDALRHRFLVFSAITLALLVGLIVGLGKLTVRAFAPPPVIGHSHGLFFVSEPTSIGSINWDEDLQQQFSDITEVFFLRTEKGQVPVLSEFVDQQVLDEGATPYRNLLDAGTKFAQTYKVLEARPVTAGGGIRRWHYAGLLSSRGIDGNQNSTLYVECDFAPSTPTKNNSIGWRLVRIARLREDEYFSEERERERIRRLGLEAARQGNQ